MRHMLYIALALVLSSCNSGRPSFVNMNEAELAAYNRGQPPEKQIFCVTQSSSSSFIRRRSCQSFEDWVTENERAAMTLDVLNSRPAYSLPNSIQDGPSRN